MLSDRALAFASPLRGEGDAPSLSPAHAWRNSGSAAGLSDRGAPGGGAALRCRPVTPTRNAIGLSSPVHPDDRQEMGELSPWRSVLPPQGGGEAWRLRQEIASC